MLKCVFTQSENFHSGKGASSIFTKGWEVPTMLTVTIHYHRTALYNLTKPCLNGTLSSVDFMDVIMGDIPSITTLCLNGTLS